MVVRLGPLEMVQRGLGLAAIVQQVRQVDARFRVGGVELERATQPVERAGVVAQAVRGIAETRRRVGRVGMRGRGQIEEPVGRSDVTLAEQGASHLQHQLVIVLEPELQNALERPHRAGAVAHLEQGLADARQAVFVIGIEAQRVLEASAGPGVLLPGEMGIGSSDMEFDRMWVEGNAFVEDQQRFIVPAFVIELMGLFVEVVGAEEGVRHPGCLRQVG
jgi:hypothetical protein